MEYYNIMKKAQITSLCVVAILCVLCAGRTVRDVSDDYSHCNHNKGQYRPNSDGTCAKSAPWVEEVQCCVKCIIYCGLGQKKAVPGTCHSPCVDCISGTFNNESHNEGECFTCTSCQSLSRKTSVACTKEADSQCGACIQGYYPSSKDNWTPCLLCEGAAEESEPTCISYNVDKKLDMYLIIGIVGGIVLLIIVIIISVCTVKAVKKRRETIRRRNSRNDHELKNLVKTDKVDSGHETAAIQTGPSLKGNSDYKVTHGAQTGPSLGYMGNGGTEENKARVTFAEPKKKKGILKVDVSKPNPRRPGDGQPDPPASSDPPPSTGSSLETKSPGDFCSKPWWLSRSTSNPSPNESFMSNEVFSDKNTPVPETPEYQASPYQKPPSLNSCVSRQSSNFQSLPSDAE